MVDATGKMTDGPAPCSDELGADAPAAGLATDCCCLLLLSPLPSASVVVAVCAVAAADAPLSLRTSPRNSSREADAGGAARCARACSTTWSWSS